MKTAATLGAVTASSAALLGVAAMLGWATETEPLARVLPISSPIAFNSALALTLSGLALRLYLLDKKRAVSLLGAVVFLMGSVTLLLRLSEAILGGRSRLLDFPLLMPGYPVGMAPVTAVGFVLVGLGTMQASRHRYRSRSWIIAFLGAGVCCLGAAALIGYAAQIPSVYHWGYRQAVSFPSALGLTLLGGGMIAIAWEMTSGRLAPGWLPYVVSLITGTLFIAIWNAHQLRQAIIESAFRRHAQVALPLHVGGFGGFADEVMLALGLLFAGIAGIAVWFWEADDERRVKLEQVNQELQSEIAERQRFEAELSYREEFLRLASDAADLGCWRWDLAKDELYFTERCARLFNLPETTVGSQRFLDVLSPEDAERVRDDVGHSIQARSPYRTEYRLVARDGTVRWIAARGCAYYDADWKATELRGVAVDISERRRADEARVQAEQELQQKEQRLQLLIEQVPAVLWTTDTQMRFTHSAGLGLSAIGLHPGDVVGQSLYEFLGTSDEQSPVIQAHRQALAGVSAEFEFVWKSRIFDVHLEPLRVGEDEIVGVVGVGLDVSERKRAQALETKLQQSQKLEAVGRLAGGVAHDFNNLLAVILGYSELVLDDPTLADGARKRISEIRKAAERAAAVTRQLLAFSRRQVQDVKVLDLNAVFTDMSEMLGRMIGEDVELVFDPVPDLGMVKVDPGQIQQVFMNLAVNARDAMPGGGRLRIRTENVELDEASVHSEPFHMVPGSYVLLEVSDTGTGMDSETQSRIFEPFFTTKARDKGTGLGLSTVYGIVKQSGGYICVFSEPGHGTTFRIYLPRVTAKPESYPAQLPTLSAAASATVLLVEDADALRSLTRELLESAGYRVLAAKDGAEAEQLASQRKERIHLLLTDIVMPGMSGRQLAKRLTTLRPDMSVVYMTGYSEEALRGQSDEFPNGEVPLQKPFTRETLLRKVERALAAGAVMPAPANLA